MNIAALLYSYPPYRHAGADVFNAHLMEALAAAGHAVHVFTNDKASSVPRPVERNGVTVHGTARNYPRRGLHVVYTAPDVGSQGARLAVQHGAKLVGIVHGTSRPVAAAVNRRNWDLLCWNSHATRTTLGGSGGIIVRPPVTVPKAMPKPGKAVTLVNLSEDKGAHVWWELAARNPTVPFIGVLSWGSQIVRHPHGTYCPNVTILPTIPHNNMGDLWARTRALLTPSKAEAWGMVAVEAFAHGVPVIAHPTPGLLESLGTDGIWADRDDLDGWHRALAALDTFPVDRAPLRARARELEQLTAADSAAFVAAVEGLTS